MCGRYSLTTPSDVLAKEFRIPPAEASRLVARYNIAPSQPVAIVAAGPVSGSRRLDHAIWGLIPSWSKDPSIGARLINARSETVLEKPSFKVSVLHRRCLVPADGYYEWRREGAARQPYYFKEKSGRPFAFAGIWSDWEDGDGGQLRTCAILTREAEGDTRTIHERMPVTVDLTNDSADRWLDPRLSAPSDTADLLRSLTPGEWRIQAVSTRVNDPRNDDEGLFSGVIDVTKTP